MAYLAQPESNNWEWLDGGTLALLIDGEAADGQLTVGRFDVKRGEAPPYHPHAREDEVHAHLGDCLVWCGVTTRRNGVKAASSTYRATSHTPTGSPRRPPDLLKICTPAGIEGMFRHAGRDREHPAPGRLRDPLPLMEEASKLYGNIIVGRRGDLRHRPGRATGIGTANAERLHIRNNRMRTA